MNSSPRFEFRHLAGYLQADQKDAMKLLNLDEDKEREIDGDGQSWVIEPTVGSPPVEEKSLPDRN